MDTVDPSETVLQPDFASFEEWQRWTLARALENAAQIRIFHHDLPIDWIHLAKPTSPLEEVLQQLPSGPVDLRLTLSEGLRAAHCGIQSVADWLRGDVASTDVVAMGSLRTAIVAAARVVYAAIPGEDRVMRSTAVMQQEATSLKRFYQDLGQTERSRQWLPDSEERKRQLLLADSLLRGPIRYRGERWLLREMARVSAAAIPVAGAEEEHLLDMFHVYSGAAHGLGWHRLLPGGFTFAMPTDFVGDFFLASIIVDRAHQVVLEESGWERSPIVWLAPRDDPNRPAELIAARDLEGWLEARGL